MNLIFICHFHFQRQCVMKKIPHYHIQYGVPLLDDGRTKSAELLVNFKTTGCASQKCCRDITSCVSAIFILFIKWYNLKHMACV